jgi:hypothetical protein
VRYQVLALAELHLSAAQQPQPAGRVDPVHPVVHGVGVDGFRILAFEAEEYRLAAAVAVTGGAERSEEFCPDRGGRGSMPSSCSPVTKRRAAFMGPTVWELDGPMPTLNRSKTLIATPVPSCGVLSMAQGVA